MREILVERRNNTLRIGIKDNGKLSEIIVEEDKNEPVIGELYKARVKNIIEATNSIFLDIGMKKQAYLYYSNELKNSNIKKGDELVVEIIKEQLNNKGAKVTTNYSLVSKHLVLESKGGGISFSKRFKDEIKKSLIEAELKPLEEGKLVVRTEASNVSMKELEYERALLIKEHEEIKRKEKYSTKLGKIYGENVTLTNVLREKVDIEDVKIILDDEDDYKFTKEYLKSENNIKIEYFNQNIKMFEFYNIEKEILKLRHNKVVLPSGGYIIIEKTEAMYTIDVNSGKSIKERSFEKTILETNLEAAREIGKQILLRNLSGIIVIDFIDLREKSHRAQILKALNEALKEDAGNIKVFPFTELDLVQVSRKRRGKSVYDYMEEKCPLCAGNGKLLKLSYIEDLIQNEIIRYSTENGINEFLIEIEETYKRSVQDDIVSFLTNICAIDKEIYINYISGIESYRVEPIIFKNQKANLEKYKIEI